MMLLHGMLENCLFDSIIVIEYDQEMKQSQTADKPMAPRGRATQQSRDTRKTNLAKQPALSLLHQDDCKTRMDIM